MPFGGGGMADCVFGGPRNAALRLRPPQKRRSEALVYEEGGRHNGRGRPVPRGRPPPLWRWSLRTAQCPAPPRRTSAAALRLARMQRCPSRGLPGPAPHPRPFRRVAVAFCGGAGREGGGGGVEGRGTSARARAPGPQREAFLKARPAWLPRGTAPRARPGSQRSHRIRAPAA